MNAVFRPLLSLAVSLLLVMADAPPKLPATSNVWTDAEKSEFRACVLKMNKADQKGATATTRLPNEPWCEVWEEHNHWMHMHPEAAARKEDHAKFSQCNRDNAAQMNGTPKQFHTAFDKCMREAYGLP